MPTLNPATLVANLNGSVTAQDQAGATALTENGKLRYRPAKGARINWALNSRLLNNASYWSAESGASLSRITGLALAQLPAGVTTAAQISIPGSSSTEGFNNNTASIPTFPAELKPAAVRASMYLWASAPVTLDIFGMRTTNRGSGEGAAAGTGSPVGGVALTTTPQKFQTNAVALTSSDVPQLIQTVGRFNGAHSAVTIYATCCLIEFQDSLGEWFDADTLAGAKYMDPRDGRVATGPDLASVSRVVAMPEPEVQNLVTNPWFAIDTTGWSAANGAIARDTTRPNYAAGQGVLTASGANAKASISINAAAAPHMALAMLASRVNGARTIRLRYNGSVIGSSAAIPAYGELIIAAPFTGIGSGAALEVEVVDSANTDVMTIQYLGAHPGVDVPTPCPDIAWNGNAIQAGCTWGGTAHQSVSTRVDSRPTVTPAAHLSAPSGSLVYRWRKDQPVGNARVLLSCGEVGVGKDRFELRETADGHLQQAWISNNSGETVVTDTSVTFAQYGWYDLYAEWSGPAIAVATDAGARVFGVRNTPSGNFGAGLLRLGG